MAPYNDSNPLLDAALEYAKRGWYVFPLKPGDKPPLTQHGLNDATLDATRITTWWRNCPTANIGIACGQSGLVVVDIDAHADGADGSENWRDVCERLELGLIETPSVSTPSGGNHLYFSYSGDGLRNTAGRLAPGIDTRAAGGYVVAPPSRLANGRGYTWDAGLAPDETALQPLPEALEKALLGAHVTHKPSTAKGAVIQAGTRNSRLASMAGAMVRQGMAYEAVLAALLEQNESCDPPLDRDEVEQIAKSVSRYEPEPDPDPTYVEHASDLGNARRFVRLYGRDLHYCDPLGGWFTWCGHRWQLDETGIVPRMAKGVALSLYDEARACPDETRRKELAKRGWRAESARSISNLLELAWSEPTLPVTSDAFDPDPWLFNCLNGTIDLRTGELHEHNREDLITRLAPVNYDPDAKNTLWEHFLDTVTNGDQELRLFLQLCAGYSLTGSTAEEKLFFIYGEAATGKSTFIEAVKRVLGDYASTAAFDTFLSRDRNGGPHDDVARLTGARLVSSIEVDKGKKLADSLVKQLTGGDVVTARHLYKRAFEFRPQFKLWLVANDAPRVTDGDSGLWRRILRVPFKHQIPEAERDPNVKLELTNVTTAGPAILAWCVQGCLMWQQQGLKIPAVVRASTDEYREENDPLKEFYESTCFVDPQARTTRKALWNAYQAWAKENGERWPLNSQSFADKIKARGCGDVKLHGVRYWKGIGLIAEPADKISLEPEPDTSENESADIGDLLF